jgi:hypothetical protein
MQVRSQRPPQRRRFWPRLDQMLQSHTTPSITHQHLPACSSKLSLSRLLSLSRTCRQVYIDTSFLTITLTPFYIRVIDAWRFVEAIPALLQDFITGFTLHESFLFTSAIVAYTYALGVGAGIDP